jgi:hypothetical protein
MSQFTQGYNAAALCLPLDKNASSEWKRGWYQYHSDIDRSENNRFL